MRLLLGVRFGAIRSVLRELKRGLPVAIHASPAGVTASKLLSADGFEGRCSFCLSWRRLSPACASATPLLRQNKVSSRVAELSCLLD